MLLATRAGDDRKEIHVGGKVDVTFLLDAYLMDGLD